MLHMSFRQTFAHTNEHGEYALLAAGAMLLACIFIRPAGLAANDGLSYFGGFLNTVVPYSFSFLLYAYFLWRVASLLALSFLGRYGWFVALVLRTMAVFLAGLVLTPHTLVNSIHTAFGSALFSLQLLLSLYLLAVRRDWLNAVIFIAELTSGLTALYYLPRPVGLLLQSQVIFQLAFGLLLRRAALATSPAKI